MATSTTDGRELPRLHGAVADLGVIVAAYPRYAQARRAVDYLSDHRFPIEYASIVGSDLSLVAKVMGRMTTARASGAGRATAAAGVDTMAASSATIAAVAAASRGQRVDVAMRQSPSAAAGWYLGFASNSCTSEILPLPNPPSQ